MLKRKIESVIHDWYFSSEKKALCIFGARQIGKTTVVEQFAKENVQCFIKIDFIETPEAKVIFETAGDSKGIFRQIELFSRKQIIPGNTLILLDEIQECPQARTAVKYLVSAGSCRIVETGSLLGVRLEQIVSLPLGFEKPVSMYPLDFEEFLWANSVPQKTIEALRNCFQKKTPVPPFVHDEMKRIFLAYVVIGGMPEVVNAFIHTHSFEQCIPLQKSLWSAYSVDITKYAQRSEIPRILDIFNSVPSQLNSSSLRFVLSKATGQYKPKFDQYQESLNWLTQAGIILPCFNTSEPVFPLKLNEKRRLFRLYALDTGLLCSNFSDIQLQIIQEKPDLNWGAILENAAAQAFCANDFELYYFNKKNMGELDFVIEEGSAVSVIEMKSGRDYKHHPALDAALKVKDWPFKSAYVFCQSNVEVEDEIYYLPWYMMFLLQKPKPTSQQILFNLEALDFDNN